MAHYEAPKRSTLMKPCLQFSVYFDSDHNNSQRLLHCCAKQKIRRKMEVVKIDRGSELNRKRINCIEVDVWFHVQDEIIPAHRLIVALHSDYLKALTNPLSSFVER